MKVMNQPTYSILFPFMHKIRQTHTTAWASNASNGFYSWTPFLWLNLQWLQWVDTLPMAKFAMASMTEYLSKYQITLQAQMVHFYGISTNEVT